MSPRVAEIVRQFSENAIKLLFINLPALPAETLESEGGFLGWVLRLIQQRRSRPSEFQRLLTRRFGEEPAELTSTIRATSDAEQLDAWLDQVVTADTLDEVGIAVPA